MQFKYTFTAALLASIALSGAAHAAFVVSYEAEKPGVQTTTATFNDGGVETFDEQPVHSYPQSFTTTFGTSGPNLITGTYSSDNGNGVQINAADQYGGAGGTGNYIVAFESTPYSLNLSTSIKGGVNYFGYWLSALDSGNTVTFYGEHGQTLFTFNPQDVIDAVNKSSNPHEYYGNPTANFKGQDGGEPFVFINFFDTTGSFSKITFNEVDSGGGYESDNHTVGNYATMGKGTIVPLTHSVSGVPEPAAWTMMILGVGAVGAVLRGRRRTVGVAQAA